LNCRLSGFDFCLVRTVTNYSLYNESFVKL
jgi:hypothetical protein